jgi:hypothetical protein
LKFENYESYLGALVGQPSLAIVPISGAVELLHRSQRTIQSWIKVGKLDGIQIGDELFVRAGALREKISIREDEIRAVKNRLADLIRKGRTSIFYSEIMPEFGYNYISNPDRKHFGWLLGQVSILSRIEMEEKLGEGRGAFLSAVVWRKDTGTVGGGFWDLVSHEYEKIPKNEAQGAFVAKHVKRCIDFYSGN